MPPWLVRDMPEVVRESSFTWHTTCDIPYFWPRLDFLFQDIFYNPPPQQYFFLVAVFPSLLNLRQFLTPNRKTI